MKDNRFQLCALAHQIDNLAGDLVEAAGLDKGLDPHVYDEARQLAEDLDAEFHGCFAGAECTLYLGVVSAGDSPHPPYSIPEMHVIWLEESQVVYRVSDAEEVGGWVKADTAWAAEEAALWREAAREAGDDVRPWRIR